MNAHKDQLPALARLSNQDAVARAEWDYLVELVAGGAATGSAGDLPIRQGPFQKPSQLGTTSLPADPPGARATAERPHCEHLENTYVGPVGGGYELQVAEQWCLYFGKR